MLENKIPYVQSFRTLFFLAIRQTNVGIDKNGQNHLIIVNVRTIIFNYLAYVRGTFFFWSWCSKLQNEHGVTWQSCYFCQDTCTFFDIWSQFDIRLNFVYILCAISWHHNFRRSDTQFGSVFIICHSSKKSWLE